MLVLKISDLQKITISFFIDFLISKLLSIPFLKSSWSPFTEKKESVNLDLKSAFRHSQGFGFITFNPVDSEQLNMEPPQNAIK